MCNYSVHSICGFFFGEDKTHFIFFYFRRDPHYIHIKCSSHCLISMCFAVSVKSRNNYYGVFSAIHLRYCFLFYGLFGLINFHYMLKYCWLISSDLSSAIICFFVCPYSGLWGQLVYDPLELFQSDFNALPLPIYDYVRLFIGYCFVMD
jgi:hypothetical protein